MKKHLSASRAVKMLKVYEETGSKAAAARQAGLSDTAIYHWLPYVGLDEKWLTRVKQLENQVRRMKLSAILHQRHMRIATTLIKTLQKSAMKRSRLAAAAAISFEIPRAVANRIVGLSVSPGLGRRSKLADKLLVDAMREHLSMYPGRGFATMYRAFLQHQPGTRERARRLYTEHLMRANRAKRTKADSSPRKHMQRQGESNSMWSMDFMQDALSDGTRYWLLNVIDDFHREAILTVAMKRRSSKAVIANLSAIIARGRRPSRIRTDNGGEFTSILYRCWAENNSIEPIYSRVSRPTDNAFIERFNRAIRAEVLNRFLFRSISTVQVALDDWRLDYNFSRPHLGLGGLSPMQYLYAHESRFMQKGTG